MLDSEAHLAAVEDQRRSIFSSSTPRPEGSEQVKTRVVSSIIGVLVTVAAQVASAATIIVNTRADNLTGGDGQCTLREALANVNAAADTTSGDCTAGTGAGDTVAFNLRLRAKIRLKLGELVIGHDVTITGPTAGSLHVSGRRASRIFHIAAGTTASLSNLTLEKGWPLNRARVSGLDPGGALLNEGALTLTNCTLANNKSLEGGAVSNSGTMTLINCTLKNNKAMVGGGGIDNAGTTTLTNCALTGNVAFTGPVGGHLGGGISNDGTMSLTNCALNGNSGSQGGGIYNEAGTMNLTNCTLKGNYARWAPGGGIMNISALTLTNCTISRNKAYTGQDSLGGGGIWQNSELSPATTIVTNTIIALNGKAQDCGGDRPTSNGHNLDSDGTCFTSGGTDLVNTDPLLAPLANYGGPTKTLALCLGAGLPSRSCTGASPAIDAGDDAVTGPPLNLTTDQRGLPRLSGEHVDIGAYEAQQ
jgi:CSLREA domain-containing protein